MEKIFWNSGSNETSPLQIAALNEHFRRMALWIEHTQQPENWPAFKVQAIPGLRCNEGVVEFWSTYLEKRSIPPVMKETIQQMIYWHAILNPNVLPTGLPDPFAALYFYLGTGGTLTWDPSGTVDFKGGAWLLESMPYYLNQPPYMEDLEETTILKLIQLGGKVVNPG